jgi:formylglycine-generating enzyme required for sulfatase activity
MKGTNPSRVRGDNLPVETVTWTDADAYCRAVDMRLPTEAEWEYAARAGNTNQRYGDIDKIAVYAANRTEAVGSKLPNAWDLYDTMGNVWEWTNDWYDKDYYKKSPKEDPPGPGSTRFKTVRGGSWGYNPLIVRVSVRNGGVPAYRNSRFGFRCAGELH